MATIDYKEKYEQAMERARQFIEKPYLEDSAGIVRYIFPEFAESEDERIRKSIIELLNEVHFTFKYYDINKMLAWLKKQSKDSPVLSNSSNTGNVEQKPAFEMKTPEESLGIDSDTYNKVVDECIYGEQKPADFSDLRTWKYIVDAVWTEKEGIGQYLDSPFTEEVAKKLQKRFGKIEQKPAWKPSDEQMEYLAKAITTLGDEGNCKTASMLNDLRVELKKLMGE